MPGQLADRKQALAIHGYDYLIGKADRHGMNLVHDTDKDGKFADLRKRHTNLDAYERAHLEPAITIWENRIKMIDATDVAKVMS